MDYEEEHKDIFDYVTDKIQYKEWQREKLYEVDFDAVVRRERQEKQLMTIVKRRIALLKEKIAKLTPTQRRRVGMFLMGLSWREIGEIEKVSHIAVRKSVLPILDRWGFTQEDVNQTQIKIQYLREKGLTPTLY